ncbi:MAG: HepT-like ribonuclease domain-containing protein, partial [Patescibacteria group bacterium]
MSKEIIQKKLDQIGVLIQDLQNLLEKSREEFLKDTVAIRAAERNFQLIVDTASDILVHALVEMGKETPDTYRQSFLRAGKAKFIPFPLARKLAESAG